MVTGTTPISQLPTGTIDNLQAVFPLSIDMPSSPDTIRATLAQTAQFLGINGFISENGAYLTYITGTSYQAEAGSAIVNNEMLTWSSPITRTGVTMTSGTISYVYLYNNAGTPALEESTTVPAWDTTLRYNKKTGDASRRCIGFLQGFTTNTIREFYNHIRSRVSEFYYTDGVSDNGGKIVVNLGTSTSSWTAIGMSNILPSHAKDVLIVAKLLLSTTGDDGTIGLSPTDMGSANAQSAIYQARGRAGTNAANIFFGNSWIPIKSTQTIYYRTTSNSGSPTAQLVVEGAAIIR